MAIRKEQSTFRLCYLPTDTTITPLPLSFLAGERTLSSEPPCVISTITFGTFVFIRLITRALTKFKAAPTFVFLSVRGLILVSLLWITLILGITIERNLKRGRRPNVTNDVRSVLRLKSLTTLYMNFTVMSKLLSSVTSTTKISSAGFRPGRKEQTRSIEKPKACTKPTNFNRLWG